LSVVLKNQILLICCYERLHKPVRLLKNALALGFETDEKQDTSHYASQSDYPESDEVFTCASIGTSQRARAAISRKAFG
jgi:hypothetical protein